MNGRALVPLIAAAAAIAALSACSADDDPTADAQTVKYDDHGPYYQAGEFRIEAEIPGMERKDPPPQPQPTRDEFADDCYVPPQDPADGWHLMSRDPHTGEWYDTLVGVMPAPGTNPGPDWRPTDRPLCAPEVAPALPD